MVTAAEREAEAIVAAAATSRNEAAQVLEGARSTVERLLATAEEEASAIRAKAEAELEKRRSALAEARLIQGPRAPKPAPAVDRVPAPRSGSGFDNAIARAVQQALRG